MAAISIVEFCEIHGACQEGRKWALDNCKDMAEAWIKLKPEWFLWVATRKGVLSDIELREFACWCVRNTPIGNNKTVWSLLSEQRSRNAVEVAEQFARGKATREELGAARNAAWAAAWAATRAAAEAAAWDATRDAQAEYLRSVVANPFAG